MFKNAMSWSRARKEFLVSTSDRPSVNPVELTYQRVTICSIYNNGKTFFGVAIQHPDDYDCREAGVEIAMTNAFIKPVFVSNGKLTQGQFYHKAEALYEMYGDNLKVVAASSISEDEWYRRDPNAPQFLDELDMEFVDDDDVYNYDDDICTCCDDKCGDSDCPYCY